MIAQLVQADEDTFRDVIHRFNEIGLACLDPRWAGGRPRRLSSDDEDFVVQTATTRPTKLGQPFTRWSIRKPAAYLRKVHGRGIRPTARSGWAPVGHPERHPATYHCTRGVRSFHGCYSIGDDRPWGVNRRKKGTVQTRALHAYLRWRNINARPPTS